MRAARNVYAIIRVSRLDPGLVQTRSWIADAGDSYDRVADRYADMVRTGLEALPLEKRLVDHFVRSVIEAGGGPVLDVGCGPGWLTRDLASRGLVVSGIDISTAMLRPGRTNNPGVGFVTASLTQIPVTDGASTGVFCWYVLRHVPDVDLAKAVWELARVIRPGGFLMLGGHVGDSTYTTTEGYVGLPMRVLFAASRPRNLRPPAARGRTGSRRGDCARPGRPGIGSHLVRAQTCLTFQNHQLTWFQ